jgi:hypothetical protein
VFQSGKVLDRRLKRLTVGVEAGYYMTLKMEAHSKTYGHEGLSIPESPDVAPIVRQTSIDP